MEINKNRSLLELKDLDFLWKLIGRNIWIILLVPFLSYLLGVIYTYRKTDIYGAKVQLLLKNDQTYDYQDPIYKGLGAYGLYTDVSNQMRILQSKDIIGEVVDRMKIDVSYYVVGRLKRKEVYGTLPFTANVEIINSNMYERPVQIKVLDTDSYAVSYELPEGTKKMECYFDRELIMEDMKLLLTRNYAFNESNITSVLEPDYEMVFHTKDNLIQQFQNNMTVTNIEFTSILEVQAQDNIGVRAKIFLDTLSEVFTDFSKQTQLEVNQNTLDNIDKQILEVQKIITSIENELLRYKSEKDILDLSREEETYFSDYVEFLRQQREVEMGLSSLDFLEDYILTTTEEHLQPPSFYILDGESILKEKVQDMYENQLGLIEIIHNYSESHPTVIKKQEELGIMKRDLLIYISNLRKALQLKEIGIEDKLKKYKGEIQLLPRAVQGVENIKRELDVNNKMYLFLLEKKTNTLIARAGIIPQVQVIEKPSSLGIIAPDKERIKRLFLLTGVIIAFLLAFIRKMFFERIRSISELSSLTSIDVIGGIPLLAKMDSEIVVDRAPKAQVTESFRTIRSNLVFYGLESKAKKIGISSFLPSEGKTFCSSNLAVILAKSDKKVLLMDFDLHRPKIHKSFQLDNSKGVSSVLTGQMLAEEVLNKEVFENLDIITSGPIPPNPSELILRKELEQVFQWASDKYDYILMDTPPFGLLNDAISLLSKVDLFIVVLNTKFANRRGISVVQKILDKHSQVSKAFLINGLRESRIRYYYTKYSYKYGYSYGYGYGSQYGYGSGYLDEQDVNS